MAFEFLEHTGDTAIRIRAASGTELLRDAARGLLAVLVAAAGSTDAEEPEEEVAGDVRETEQHPVALEAVDGESLLVDFLNELVFLFDSRRFLCARADLDHVLLHGPASVRGVLHGETFDPARHALLTEVKAATYHGLDIRVTPEGLEATIVLDL